MTTGSPLTFRSIVEGENKIEKEEQLIVDSENRISKEWNQLIYNCYIYIFFIDILLTSMVLSICPFQYPFLTTFHFGFRHLGEIREWRMPSCSVFFMVIA